MEECKKRLNVAIDYLIGANILSRKSFASDIANKIGRSRANVSSAINGREKYLTEKFITRFAEAYGINVKWLLSGEGSMLKQPKTIEAEPFTPNRVVQVPLVSQYAQAGYLSGYTEAEYIEQLPTISFTPDREMTGVYLAFEVKGDSMDDGSKDAYEEGEILICREVEKDYWKDSRLHINRRDFVIVHEEGILIKRIIAHNVEKHTITIHSLNPEYPDREIDLASVYQIFSVVESRRQRRR